MPSSVGLPKTNDDYSEHESEVEPRTCAQKCGKGLKDNLFTIFTLIGVAIGFGIGFGVATTNPDPITIDWINMPGRVFIRLLQLTILPIISANIIVVMASMDPKKNGKVGIASALFIFIFDIISGFIGVIIAIIMQPGTSHTDGPVEDVPPPSSGIENEAPVTTSDIFADLFLNIFPDNVLGIAIFQVKTVRVYPDPNNTEVTKRLITNMFSTDMIGLIFTSIVFGIAARAAGESGQCFIDFFQSLSEVVLKLMQKLLKLTPIGVCFMVAGAVVGLQDVAGTFQSLGMFMATVLVALAVHMIIQLIVYAAFSFRNPFKVLYMGFQVFFLAFITTAPLIAIPQMLEFCDKYGIHKKVSRFVIPLSAALKGDGSGAFQAVACVFIAQLAKFPLSAGTFVVIGLLTGFATLAIPNVPSSSIIIILTILSSLSVPTANVSLLFAVEWFMDRCRSGSIGYGHLFAAAFTHSIAIGRRTEKPGHPDEGEIGAEQHDEFTVESPSSKNSNSKSSFIA